MHELLATVAHGLDGILPDGFQLPSLTYVLPHSVYWIGLILFPLAAMYMVRRAERQRPSDAAAARIKPAIAWLLWKIGRASWRERVCLEVEISVIDASLKQTTNSMTMYD